MYVIHLHMLTINLDHKSVRTLKIKGFSTSLVTFIHHMIVFLIACSIFRQRKHIFLLENKETRFRKSSIFLSYFFFLNSRLMHDMIFVCFQFWFQIFLHVSKNQAQNNQKTIIVMKQLIYIKCDYRY